MTFAARIDVHQHLIPHFWAEVLADHGGDPSGWHHPAWSPQSAVEFMDSQQIATGVPSLTAPGMSGWTGEARRNMARKVNDYAAALVSERPDRFGAFATLPLPDIDGSLLEIAYVFDTVRADGVILLSNYGGLYPGDPAFEPVWAELDRRSAVVFIHPGKPALSVLEGIPGPIVDYPFDTTRAAVQMALNGVLDRYRRMRVILSHAGGFLPFAAERFAEAAALVRPNNSPAQTLEAFRRFYFDTALSSGPAALQSLKTFAGSGRILFGSDFPYAPAELGGKFTAKLDADTALTDRDRAAINHENAHGLFERLRKPASA